MGAIFGCGQSKFEVSKKYTSDTFEVTKTRVYGQPNKSTMHYVDLKDSKGVEYKRVYVSRNFGPDIKLGRKLVLTNMVVRYSDGSEKIKFVELKENLKKNYE